MKYETEIWYAEDNADLDYCINPIWTGLFANLKGLGAPPNLTISSQMMMKLGKDIIWVEIFTN